MNPLIQLKKATPIFLVGLVLACFALPQRVQATDLGSVLPGGNTADGFGVLTSLTTGGFNTGTGWFSLKTVSSGSFNTAFGAATLFVNTGNQNTAVGTAALFSNTTGERNNAVGSNALRDNMSGSFNNAFGSSALLENTSGSYNNAFGNQALLNCTGSQNTAIGDGAGYALTTGSGNVCIGAVIFGAAGESNTTRIRNVHATVQPVVGTDPDYVTVNSGGRLGRGNISSRRYKHDIQPMDKASEALHALKPVSFRYNKEYDATQTIAFGLIAEDVAEVNGDLVGRNPKGEPESVRYEQINAMLLNEFLKEHRKVQEQEATIAQLKSTLAKKETIDAHQQKQIEALTSGLQKVSAQLEASKPAPQVAQNTE